MIDLIDRFLAAPASTDAKPILAFMRDSPAVMVVINQRIMVGSDDPALSDDAKAQLLAGFVAGNMRKQLESGTKADAPVDGAHGMLKIYAVLKSKTEGLSVPALEIMFEQEAAGTLAAHVEKLLAGE